MLNLLVSHEVDVDVGCKILARCELNSDAKYVTENYLTMTLSKQRRRVDILGEAYLNCEGMLVELKTMAFRL